MASKMEDLRYPALSDFKRYLRNEFENLGISSELSDYKALRTESLITNILEYRFNLPFSLRYFDRYSRAAGFELNSQRYKLGYYILLVASFYPRL